MKAKKQVIFSDEGTSKNFSCPSSNGFCTDPVTYTTDRSMPTDTITNNQSPAPAAVVRECTVKASLHTTGTDGTQITDSNKKKSFLEIVTQTEEGFKSRPVDDGYILVQKRRLRNRFLGKTGNAVVDTSSNFKAADIKVDMFLSDSFWPDGVNYRRFVEFNRSSLKNDYRHIDKSK
ncbi:hypothetical protein ACJJTC_012503 [Scirpophaga incertulas]